LRHGWPIAIEVSLYSAQEQVINIDCFRIYLS